MDEIPEAIRVRESIPQRKRSPLPLIFTGVFCLALFGSLAIFLAFSSKQPLSTVDSSQVETKVDSNKTANSSQVETKVNSSKDTEAVASSASAVPKSLEPTPSAPTSTVAKENLLGHLPYEETLESNLEAITADGSVRLHSKAAAKFREMQAAAKADGIDLIPVSGFRSVESQEQLFFEIKEERVQDATKRAEVSAPPGYSEHHTGYAIDIGDGNVPQANVEPEFENTAAFRWLQANAAKYSFELSFPPNNSQGISYEPWHWRYVGDRHSLETFYKVRKTN